MIGMKIIQWVRKKFNIFPFPDSDQVGFPDKKLKFAGKPNEMLCNLTSL